MDTPPLTRETLLRHLRELHTSGDPEKAHCLADDLLLAYLNDPEITAAFADVPRWYA